VVDLSRVARHFDQLRQHWIPSGEAASCSSSASVIPGCSFWQPASACLASAICAGVGVWVEVVLDVVSVLGAAPPVEAVDVVSGALWVVVGALLCVVVVVVAGAAAAVVLVVCAAGALGAAAGAVVEAVCDLEAPQPARTRMVRVTIAIRFIAPR
jgi:hypothetical protein